MDSRFAVLVFIVAQICGTLALPPCVCTRNLRPVCGSDGKTYSNQCVLECAAYKSATEITVAKQGSCKPPAPEEQICICTYEYKPVCGTDGQTYPNECAMNCQKSSNPSLKVDYVGNCRVVEEPGCFCTDIYQPVCGSDGKTYGNDCDLNCATRKSPMLSIVHSGECDHSVKVVNNL